MARRNAASARSSRAATWETPFRFAAATHQKLVRLLGLHIVDVDVLVKLLEAQAGSYVLIRPAKGRPRVELDTLQSAAEELSRRLGELGDDAIDATSDALTMRGYDATTFLASLRNGLQLLSDAAAEATRSLPAKGAGRPPELTRAWLARGVRITLEEHGFNADSRAGARALSQCLRIILGAVGEPVPYDMRPLLTEARRA